MTGPRLLSPRWIAAGGITILAAVLGTVLLLQNGGSACAAPPTTSLRKGVATYFFLEGTLGNCSYPGPPADDLYVALGPSQYAGSASCGTYIDVTGPKGKVRVKVIDSCPECPAGHLDLSLTAFKRIAAPIAGRVPIKYKAVPGAAPPGPISVRVKEGSSRYWLSVLVDNHAHQLSSVKIAGKAGKFHIANREEWNYWTIPNGLGNGPFQVRITDIYGRTVTVPNIKLAAGRTQKTSARLSGLPPTAHINGAIKEKAGPKPAPPATSPSSSAARRPSVPTGKRLQESTTAAAVTTATDSTATAATTAAAETTVDLAAGSPSACR